MMKRLNRHGSIRFLFILFLLVAAAFVIISFGKPYYRYYTLKSFTHDELLMDVGEVREIRHNVRKRAEELGISLDDLHVTKNSKVVTVTAQWSEVVDFWGYYRKRINFDMKESY